MSTSSLGRIVNSLFFQYSLLFIIAIIIWQIFYPGLMSPDSLDQYGQAQNGVFVDWHPPIMSIILSGLMKLGGDIGLMILIQCLAALFGMRAALSLLLTLFSNGYISRESARLIATIVTILFLIPFISPYGLFSIIFWKDAWIAIGSLWVISYLLWLFLNYRSLSPRAFIIHVALLSASSALMVLTRHNAIVMSPIISVILAILIGLKLGRKWLIVGAIPMILAFVLNPIIYTVFNVGRTYTGNSVLSSDLAVMLKLYPELEAEYPLSARHKNAPTVLLTDNGGVWNETTEGKPCPYINKRSCDSDMPLACFGNHENTFNIQGNDCYMPVGRDNKTLKDEYFKAWTTHPFKILKAKVYLFWQMLHSRNWQADEIPCEISGNTMGLKLNDNFTGARESICYLSHEVANKSYFNWISGIHPLWLFLNIIFVIYFAVKFLLKKDAKSIFVFLLFLMPLSYYLSYILAATTPDYRFMYPSTVMMQVIFVSLMISNVPRLYRNFITLGTNAKPEKDKEWKPEEKAEIVIEGLKGRSEAELCRTYNLDHTQYSKWRDEFLSNAAAVFKTNNFGEREKQLELENQQLRELVEELKAKLK